ncbi:hypothetical protein PanWU01x14_139000, partial [Parasponia andersonii]
FPTQHGVGEVRGNQYDTQTCYNNSLKLAAKDVAPRIMMVQLQGEAAGEASSEASSEVSGKMSIKDLYPREVDEELKTRPIEDLEDLPIDRSSKVLKIRAKL